MKHKMTFYEQPSTTLSSGAKPCMEIILLAI